MVAEDWDLHLLESYVIALQIAQRKDHIVVVIDFIRKIAFLLGETGRFDQSFQCLYSLLLHLRRVKDDNDPSVANFLLNMSHLVDKVEVSLGSAPFHEEFVRITSATLGVNHSELIPSIVHLGLEMLKSGQYDNALKWADIGLSSLQAMKSLGNEAMTLTLVKVRNSTA